MRSGNFSILNTTEYHKTENGCLLSDILEPVVDKKYFLSKEQTERIVFTSAECSTPKEKIPKDTESMTEMESPQASTLVGGAD